MELIFMRVPFRALLILPERCQIHLQLLVLPNKYQGAKASCKPKLYTQRR